MDIYCHVPLADDERAYLLNALTPTDACLIAQDLTAGQRVEAARRASIIFGNVPVEWLSDTPNLQWLQLNSAGLDPYNQLDWSQRPNVVVTNLHGFFGQPCAETVLAGILAFYRGVVPLLDYQRRSQWTGGQLRPSLQLLSGKNALLLGAGAIGQRVGTLLSAFDCSVTYLQRTHPPTLADLDSLLPQADVVVAALPETPETMKLFNNSRFTVMKPGSILVNVGRGSVLDEDALLEALTNGTLAGAVLDVTAVEPLPADSPLWQRPNVVLTQHTGGGYADEKSGKVGVFTDNLRRFRAGKALQHRVDFEKGY